MDSSYQQNNSFDDNNDPSKNTNDDESKKNHSKKGKGRQKIPMEKIKSETNRQVTFSKRRVGLFKKASELHTLCGGENAIVVFSPSNKAHSFAATNIETTTDQFLNQIALGGTRFIKMPSAQDNPIILQRNAELTNLERLLEDEKRKKKEHDRTRKVKMNEIEYPPNIDLLDFNQLQALNDNLLRLKNDLTTVKGESLDVGGGGPGVGYPMDTNIQDPPSYNNMASQFYYDYTGTMLNDNNTFVPDDGLTSYQTMFDFTVNDNNNPSVWCMNNSNNNNPNGAAFPIGMVTNNHGCIDQMVNNNNSANQFPPRPNDHEARGSLSLMFLNNKDVPNKDEDGEARGGGEHGYNQYKYGGFNNYNNFGY